MKEFGGMVGGGRGREQEINMIKKHCINVWNFQKLKKATIINKTIIQIKEGNCHQNA